MTSSERQQEGENNHQFEQGIIPLPLQHYIETDFSERNLRLSKSIRIAIRNLKKQGDSQQAHLLRELEFKKKIRRNYPDTREGVIKRELDLTVFDLVNSQDRLEKAVLSIKGVNLLYALRLISDDKRGEAINEIYAFSGIDEEEIIEGYQKIRDFEKLISP